MKNYLEPFGNFLATVQERDIDMLLIEEFHSSPNFAAWFSEQIGLQSTSFVGAWHSVCDADGETDLLVVVSCGAEKVGVFIENKIGALEQDNQDSRYHVRGARSVSQGKIDSYLTVICAPSGYLELLSEQSEYQYQISYEGMVDWFCAPNNRRSKWKHLLLQEAIEQRRRSTVKIENPLTSRFHMDFWLYLKENHPDIQMIKPTPKGSKSNWIITKMAMFPKQTKIHFKFDKQQVELGFGGRKVEEIEQRNVDLSRGMFLAQKGKTAAICMAMPAIKILEPIDNQTELIEEAILIARKLSKFSRLFAIH